MTYISKTLSRLHSIVMGYLALTSIVLPNLTSMWMGQFH